MYREDYSRAGCLVLPVGELRDRFVVWQSFAASLALIPVSLIPMINGESGPLFISQVECRCATIARDFDHLSSFGFYSKDAGQKMNSVRILSMTPGTVTAFAAIFGSIVGAFGVLV
jgi:hypothetical protein